ncbi:MAG: ATP-dependent helicase HrpB [Microthrixaceae bacterium]|nr:ATP-dependent helicase HrpB [Microthrixaceae bacterium]
MPSQNHQDAQPVLQAVPAVLDALDRHSAAVLVAPPGTGKTTGVPPAIAAHHDGRGPCHRTVVVVPRRMAARAAAKRMAEDAGEVVGGRFGYSVATTVRSARTVVEAVTPGLLLRRIQADPELTGTTTVVLDEFHERSLDQDLLLALLLDVRHGLREDLRLLVMSATLDVTAVTRVLGDQTPVVSVEAPLHAVTTHWRPGSAQSRSPDGSPRWSWRPSAPPRATCWCSFRDDPRSPPRPDSLSGRLGAALKVLELHGSLSVGQQDEILSRHQSEGRRVILSTSIAETSLTVPGVRTVVDSGLRRYQSVSPATGIPTLRTGAVSLSGADQRRGRAAREAPGTCFRLWSRSDEELRRRHDPPEITVADLSPLLLATTAWGASSPEDLTWLEPPPTNALEEARELLGELGAIDSTARMTPHGRSLAAFGFHPRVAAMAVHSATIGERDVAAEVLAVLDHTASTQVDLTEEVRRIRSGSSTVPARAVRGWSRRIERLSAAGDTNGPATADTARRLDTVIASVVLAGYADRLARRRDDRRSVYLLRHGGEVELPRGEHHLQDSAWLVVIDLDARSDAAGPGRIHLAVAIEDSQIDDLLSRAGQAGEIDVLVDHRWSPSDGSTSTTTTRRLGAITLDTSRRRSIPIEALDREVAASIAERGPSVLRHWGELSNLLARFAFMRTHDPQGGWPDLSEGALTRSAPTWVPALIAVATSDGNPGEVSGFDPGRRAIEAALLNALPSGLHQRLDRHAPELWRHPDGRRFGLAYGAVDGDPRSVLLAVRLRDLLGIDDHPSVGRDIPVTVELQSPAGRMLQRTNDLPGFWRGAYPQVRSEMRGRYPKHSWPERPWEGR